MNKIIEIIDPEYEEIFTVVEGFEILDVATDEEVWAEIEKYIHGNMIATDEEVWEEIEQYIHNDTIATDEEVRELIERSFK